MAGAQSPLFLPFPFPFSFRWAPVTGAGAAPPAAAALVAAGFLPPFFGGIVCSVSVPYNLASLSSSVCLLLSCV